jgi:putrescine aminotransferase
MIGGIEVNRDGFGPLLAEASLVPFDSAEALEREIERVGSDNVAAFFCEPMMGAGGVLLPPEGYLEATAAVCARHGVLFVCDSVICGFGRLGTWFGIERFGVVPDMIVFAKGVSSRYLPVGGVVISTEIPEPLWSRETARAFRHGTTYPGHPTCCVAALTNLDILEEEDLLGRSRVLEGELATTLGGVTNHPYVAEVRCGLGFLGAVELDATLLERDPRDRGPWTSARDGEHDGGLSVRRGEHETHPCRYGRSARARIPTPRAGPRARCVLGERARAEDRTAGPVARGR